MATPLKYSVYNPRTAKFRLEMRPLSNGAFIAVIGISLVFTFSYFWWWWVADTALMGLLYYFYFFVLANRPIKLRCPHCRKIIRSNTPWVCGFCKKANTDADEFPFIRKCKHTDCLTEPKAYKCHHQKCGGMIFLTDDELEPNYAHCLNSPAEIPEPSARSVKLQEYEVKKEDKINEIEMAELDLKLKEIKTKHDGPKIKSAYEQKQEMCDREYIGIMGIHEYVRRKTIEVKELYKDDPESLKDALAAIEEIRKRHI